MGPAHGLGYAWSPASRRRRPRSYRRGKLADGTSVFIETDLGSGGPQGPQRVSRGASGAQEAQERFEDAAARIRPAAQALLDSLKGLSAPEEIALEFGIKLNPKAGVVIASVDSEATFKVSLKWKNAG